MEVRKFITKSGHEGHDLNDVVRAILSEHMERRDWNETQAAKAMGVGQKSFNRFMKGEHGLRLASLARLCAELETNPVSLLQSSGIYDPEARAKMRYTKDALYDRFRMSLGNDEAADLLKLIDEAKTLGAFASVVASARGAVEAARSARRKGIQHARGTPPKLPSRNRAGRDV